DLHVVLVWMLPLRGRGARVVRLGAGVVGALHSTSLPGVWRYDRLHALHRNRDSAPWTPIPHREHYDSVAWSYGPPYRDGTGKATPFHQRKTDNFRFYNYFCSRNSLFLGKNQVSVRIVAPGKVLASFDSVGPKHYSFVSVG